MGSGNSLGSEPAAAVPPLFLVEKGVSADQACRRRSAAKHFDLLACRVDFADPRPCLQVHPSLPRNAHLGRQTHIREGRRTVETIATAAPF